MTDHRSGEPEVTSTDIPEGKDKPSKFRFSLSRRSRRVLGVAAMVTAATVLAGRHSADNWNEKLDGYKKNTAAQIEKQRQSKTAQCLGRTLVLASGTKYRSTPNSEDFHSKIPGAKLFGNSNIVGVVKPKEELEVKMPKLSLDKDGNSWISFVLEDDPTSLNTKKPGPFMSSTAIAAKTVYVNYGQLKGQENPEKEPYITETKLAGTPDLSTDLVDCKIMNDGHTTVNDSPVAYGTIYPDGHFEEFTNLMEYPEAA